MRKIILGIGKNMCLYWIRKYAKKLESKETPNTQVNVIEIEGLLAYTKAKKQNYAITLMAKKTRQIVCFDVVRDKSEQIIQKLVDRALKAKHYYSDANPNYQKLSYSVQHFYFRDKSHTFTVESVNSDIRKYIAAFQRKAKFFFSLTGDLSSNNGCF